MAGSRNHSTTTTRRKRGIGVGPNLRPRINSPASKSRRHSMSTPPATPKRSKKRVRFSDPRPETELGSTNSGLTPLISRTTLSSTAPPAGHHIPASTLWDHGNDGRHISRTMQFEPLRQMLEPRAKRRLRRNRLSEEANNIEWEHRQEVKLLRAEVERLRRELEAKCVEIQSIRDMEDLAGQEESAGSITTKKELAARVHELEQQVADLKAELLQKEVESEDFGDVASRDLLNHNEDDGRVITNDDLQETQIGEDIIGIPTRLDTPFPSPPPTMPNTPCKPPLSINARIPTSIPSPDSANEALNNQLRSKLRLRGRNGLVNHTAKTADSSIVRLRKEKVGMETQVIGAPKRRQGARFISMLVPEY